MLNQVFRWPKPVDSLPIRSRRNDGATMRFPRNSSKAVIVSKNNGYGLTIDAEILAAALAEIGVFAEIVQPADRGWWARCFGKPVHEFVFHLERVYPSWLKAGGKNILIPNQERFPRRHLKRLGAIDLVLAKTRHAQSIFAELGVETTYVGFASLDLYKSSIETDWRKVLHVAGGSTLKGTEDVLALWQKHPEWPTLFLVQKGANIPSTLPPNIKAQPGFLSGDELQELMNNCGIHLCPSRSEGWGHYIHEALGCGAVVVTTDAPPMNECVDADTGVLVAASRQEKRHLGTNFYVDPISLEQAIDSTLTTEPFLLAEKGRRARQVFLDGKRAFSDRLAKALAGL